MYNIIFYVFQGAAMILASTALRRFPSRYCARIGILLSSVGYLLLLVLRENSVNVMPLLALVMGSGGAFYWISFAMLLSDASSDSNRDKAWSYIGMTGSVVSLIVPFSAGNIIGAVSGIKGYIIVFGLAFAVAIITVLLSMRIKENSAEAGKNRFKEAINLIKSIKSAKYSYTAIAFLGLREGSASFVLNILLFQMLRDEKIVGINTLLTGAAAILANMLCSKIMHPQSRVRIFNTSVTILLITCLLLLANINVYTVIAVAMMTAALTALMNNSANSVFFATFDGNDGLTTQLRPEMFAIKELILSVGRVAGIFVLYFVPNTFAWCMGGLIILTVLQYFTGLMCRKSVQEKKREKGEL